MNGIRKSHLLLVALLSAVVVLGEAQAAPIAYPANGQSLQEQKRDDRDCYHWARGATGKDPAALAAAPAPQPQPAVGGGERVGGAIRGAVIGGIIGVGDGALKGAGVGVVAGGAHARHNQCSRQAQEQSRKQGQIDIFYRAHSACMEGRAEATRSSERAIMKLNRYLSFVAFCVLGTSALAGDFDGSKALICAPVSVMDYERGDDCFSGLPEDVDAPAFMRFDFEKKLVIGQKVSSPILFQEATADRLVLQGREAAYGWTIVIGARDGDMTVTLATLNSAVVMYGSRTTH